MSPGAAAERAPDSESPRLDPDAVLLRAARLGHNLTGSTLRLPLQVPPAAPAGRMAQPAIQRMTADDLAQLEPEERAIFRDWVEWAKVYGGAHKTEEQVLAEYTVAGLQGALSEYTTNPWRRFIALFAAMAREGKVPLQMYEVMLFDDIVQVKAPELALDLARLAGIKGLGLDELTAHLDTWKDVVQPRGYPYPFASLEKFQIFKEGIIGLAKQLGVRFSAICVQGSSLRRPDPGDVDIGIIVNGEEFQRLGEILLAGSGNQRAVKKVNVALAKGKLDPYLLSFLTKAEKGITPVFELAKQALAAAEVAIDIQVSVILEGSGFDTRPFLDF